jgi:predicted transcriptional regulator
MFRLFKKEKKIEPTQFFDFPRNEEGINKVIDWLKTASELIVDIDQTNHIYVSTTSEGKTFLSVYTDVHQRVPAYKKNDRFITLDFAGIVSIFEENMGLDFLWLNPNSDSVQLNRSVFTAHYRVEKNSEIQIGLPAERPVAIIDFLLEYAQSEPSIRRIYLGLMRNKQEFSYVVFIDSDNVKAIVPEIGPKIGELCLADDTLYPVDFIYDNFLNEDQYLIYVNGVD